MTTSVQGYHMSDQGEILNSNPFIHKRTFVTNGFVIEEDGTGAVIINGRYTLYGFVDSGKCHLCGEQIRIYDVQHDNYICIKDNLWCHPWCPDPECRYCNNHPERPLPTFGVNDDTFPKRDITAGWSRIKMFIGIDV
jgi:hypothetical protein